MQPDADAGKTSRRLALLDIVRQNCLMKKEFVFQIEQDGDMLVATCHEPEMATQGENLDELLDMIRDLIRCRFEDTCIPVNYVQREGA
jgi:predicted RNase H-like HicB family nuclease